MDDPVLVMAILSFGLFAGMVATGIFYLAIVRPRLLELDRIERRNSDPLPRIIDMGKPEYLEEVQSSLADLRSTLETVHQQSDTQLDQQRITLQQLGEKIVTRLENLGQIEMMLRDTRQDITNQQQVYQALIDQLRVYSQDTQRQIVTLNQQMQQQDQRLTELLSQQAGQLSELSQQSKVIAEQTQHRGFLDTLARQISGLTSNFNGLKRQRPPFIPARLSDIRGIGPVYSGMLHEAGIVDFEQLAALTPDEVRNLIHVPRWRRINAESWIEQAKLFASQRRKLESGE